MRNPSRCIIFTALTFLVLGPLGKVTAAGEVPVQPVSNETFKEKCGACHLAYQPGLLPSGSWSKILEGVGDHFGNSLDIDGESRELIARYLADNAAEHSAAERSLKIMKSLNGQTPSRITEIPYIRRKHRDISPEVFARQAIGSFANCSACHTTAEQGNYNDDNVVIPK